jgi:hypothetical protein
MYCVECVLAYSYELAGYTIAHHLESGMKESAHSHLCSGFRSRLREFVQSRYGGSKSALRKKAGFNKGTMLQWFSGRRAKLPSAAALYQLGEAGVSIDYLLFGGKDRPMLLGRARAGDERVDSLSTSGALGAAFEAYLRASLSPGLSPLEKVILEREIKGRGLEHVTRYRDQLELRLRDLAKATKATINMKEVRIVAELKETRRLTRIYKSSRGAFPQFATAQEFVSWVRGES